MKKALSLILTVLLFVLCFNISPAADENVSFAVASYNAKQDETFSVNITVSNNIGFSKLVLTPTCNESGITLSSAKIGNYNGFKFEQSGNILTFTSENDVTFNGVICTLTFRVAASVKPGDYDIILNVTECESKSGNVPFTTKKGTISVECKKHDFKYFTEIDSVNHSAKCSICYKTEEIPHNWTDENVIIKEATCKSEGKKHVTCGDCGLQTIIEIPKSDAHKYGDWTINSEPDCTTPGEKSRECEICEYIDTAEIEAKGHDFGDFKVLKKATCTEDGEQEHKCKVCDFVETEEIKATGHEFGEMKTTKKATIGSEGLKEAKCKHCKEKQEEVIPCGEKDKETGIIYSAELGVFKSGTKIETELVTRGSAKEKCETALFSISDTFFVYNISAVYKKETVKPNGVINITFKVPSGFEEALEIYYITEVGVAEKVESKLSDDKKNVTITTDKLGTFTVCKLGYVSQNTASAKRERGNFKVFFIALSVVIVLSFVTAYFALKKRVYVDSNEQ